LFNFLFSLTAFVLNLPITSSAFYLPFKQKYKLMANKMELNAAKLWD
jgi:hypothetical protein